MNIDREVSSHYSRGNLVSRLNAALREDGVDPDHPSIEELAPYDQFHGRGLEATVELAGQIQVGPADHILDIGSGIGGPARYFASRFGCRVTGIDLTPEFCDVADHFTRLLQLSDRITFEIGDALRMPFPESSFDGAYSMNVSMNIADKALFYREIHRLLLVDDEGHEFRVASLSMPKIQSDMRRLCLDQPYSSLPRANRLRVRFGATVSQSTLLLLRDRSVTLGPATPGLYIYPITLMLPANSDDAIRQLAAEK